MAGLIVGVPADCIFASALLPPLASRQTQDSPWLRASPHDLENISAANVADIELTARVLA